MGDPSSITAPCILPVSRWSRLNAGEQLHDTISVHRSELADLPRAVYRWLWVQCWDRIRPDHEVELFLERLVEVHAFQHDEPEQMIATAYPDHVTLFDFRLWHPIEDQMTTMLVDDDQFNQ